METRRGKYWEPNAERFKRAEAKRERRKARNLKQVLREHWSTMYPGYARKTVV